MDIETRVRQVTGNDKQKINLGVRNYRAFGKKFFNGLDDGQLKQAILDEIDLRAVRQERRVNQAYFDQLRQEAWHPEEN